MQRNSQPITWRPRGVSDALDGSAAFQGAMSLLANLIPDPSTAGLWQCRPAALKKVDFAAGGFVNPGFVSVYYALGNLVYGLVATTRNPGRDEPFCYNLATGAFVPVAGVTLANTPVSPLSAGAWTPPTMDLVGALLVVTHPGFNGTGGNFFAVFSVGNPAAPTWAAGNLGGGVQFTVAPSAVAQFNGRAYYIVNAPSQPAVVFSDVLNALNVTNPNQVLTFGDSKPLTALGPLPLSNQLGGIVQSLMVFKDVSNIFQILGDAALNTLSVNALNVATGTLAPMSVVTTPRGLAFMSPAGFRIIGFDAKVSDPIGDDGKGVTVPFIYAVQPSRVAAACSGDVLRVSTQNGNAPGAPYQEYWYHFSRGVWSGPHSFPFSSARLFGNSFVVAPQGVTGSLWQSDVVQSIASTFVENGVQMTFDWRTVLLPDTDRMTENCVTEAVLDIGLQAGYPPLSVKLLTQDGTALDTVALAPVGQATLWGQFQWGHALWGGTPNPLAPRRLNWSRPLVFARAQVDVSGQSAQYVKISTLHLRYQALRFLTDISAAA